MRALVPIVVAIASSPLVIGMAAAQTPDPDPMDLVRSERGFARDVADRGIRDGFLAHLAEGSVVFAAGPVDGRASYVARPATESRLAWDPVYAEISAGGDLGWTTGPWTFRPGEGEPVVAAGHYVSLWRLEEDGVRRVELDVGIAHEPGAKPSGDPITRVLAGVTAPPGDPDADLREADQALSAAAALDLAAAYAARAAPDLRVYRMGTFPVVGEAAVRLALERGPLAWEMVGAGVSDAGDLGYTYGRARRAEAEDPAGYLRIWRWKGEGGWRLALDLADVPPAP